jgi:hypothetical protein
MSSTIKHTRERVANLNPQAGSFSKFWLAVLVILPFFACRKAVEADPPVGQLSTVQVFATEESARSALYGLYSQMMNSNLLLSNGGMSIYPALSADELTNTAANTDQDAFRSNAVPPTNTTVLRTRLWSSAYGILYHANALLEGVESSTALSEGVKRQLAGEARLVRAFYYFYLVNLFGDVPLVLGTDYRVNAALPRAPNALVYAQVVEDLQKAVQLLGEGYPSSGRVRPNKWAAAALLARVHLYQGQWAEAEAQSSAVIGSGLYPLPAPDKVFTAGSAETIWSLVPVSTSANTAEGATFIPASATARPALALTPQLLGAFKTGDGRKSAWTKTVTVAGQPYTYPFKYRIRSGGAPYGEHNIVLRTAEQYLIRAEARAEQDRLTEALQDLNVVRQRAGLPPSAAATKEALLRAIEEERQVELMTEWGHRWLDLKRWGRADAVLGPLKGGWQSTAVLYPIPQAELLVNPALTQNPGY